MALLRGRGGVEPRVGRAAGFARGLHQGGHGGGADGGSGGAGKHMQPVADAQLLDVAEPGVQPDEGLGGIHVRRQTDFGRQPRGPGLIQNGWHHQAGAAGIEALGLGIFIEQRFDPGNVAGQAGSDQRRGHVTQRHRADPAAGLCRLAGSVDDEGINDGHRPQRHLRPGLGIERHGLARQPFERAVGADMDERVDGLDAPEPEVDGEIGMARRAALVVAVGLAILRPAAIRLKGDDQPAGSQMRDDEVAVDEGGILLGRAVQRDD